MTTISIKRRGEERKDGKAALYVVFYIQRKKIRMPLNISVSQKEWDEKNGVVKGRSAEVADQNLIINNTKARVSDVFVRARLSGEILTKKRFFELYKRVTIGSTQTFNEFAHQHLRGLFKALSFNTIKGHRSVLKKLDTYKSAIEFSDLTTTFIRNYEAHLRKIGNCENTISKNLKIIKTYVLAAKRAGLLACNPFDDYRIRKSKPNIMFLTEEELGRIIKLYKSDTLSDAEQTVLRFFLFMCFTSLHIGDARALTIKQIYAGEIHYVRKKTHLPVAIPISAAAQKLIDFYRGDRTQGTLITSLPSDQKINHTLKQIAVMANVDKSISAKAARHTFATLYYKKNEGDLATLSNILGHSNIAMTMVYAHITQENRERGIQVFNSLL